MTTIAKNTKTTKVTTTTVTTSTSARSKKCRKCWKGGATVVGLCALVLWASYSTRELNSVVFKIPAMTLVTSETTRHARSNFPVKTKSEVSKSNINIPVETTSNVSTAFNQTKAPIRKKKKKGVFDSPGFSPCPSPSELRFPLKKSGGKFAIAFAVGGCTEQSCIGYVLNSVVASRVLQTHNSTVPVYLLVRMAAHMPPNATLHIEQETWLKKAGVRLQYVPRVKRENLGTITLEKFRIMEMTEYDRVMFLDSDAVPRCNIDYFFEASYQGLLSGFFGIEGTNTSMIASMFMVTPADGLFKRFMDVIHKQRSQRKSFDKIIGWGHKIAPNDGWHGSRTNETSTKWDMYGGQIDQGLLYYFFKYEMLNLSVQLRSGVVERWQEVPMNWNQTSTYKDAVVIEAPHQKFIYKNTTNPKPLERNIQLDVFHFAGHLSKPWMKAINVTEILDIHRQVNYREGTDPPQKPRFWLHYLGKANQTWQLQLPPIIKPTNRSQVQFYRRMATNGAWDVQLFDPKIDLPVPL